MGMGSLTDLARQAWESVASVLRRDAQGAQAGLGVFSFPSNPSLLSLPNPVNGHFLVIPSPALSSCPDLSAASSPRGPISLRMCTRTRVGAPSVADFGGRLWAVPGLAQQDSRRGAPGFPVWLSGALPPAGTQHRTPPGCAPPAAFTAAQKASDPGSEQHSSY